MALPIESLTEPIPIHRYDRHGQIVEISWIHHLVHIGEMKKFIDLDTSVDIATPKIWLFKAGDSNIRTHFFAALNSVGGYYSEFYEAPTVTTLGDSFFPFAFNRTINTPTTIKGFKDGTISSAGTLIGVDAGGAGALLATGRGGGVSRNEIEYLLRPNTVYMYRATVVNNGTFLGIEATFYEQQMW